MVYVPVMASKLEELSSLSKYGTALSGIYVLLKWPRIRRPSIIVPIWLRTALRGILAFNSLEATLSGIAAYGQNRSSSSILCPDKRLYRVAYCSVIATKLSEWYNAPTQPGSSRSSNHCPNTAFDRRCFRPSP
jgi:hypothetical protein